MLHSKSKSTNLFSCFLIFAPFSCIIILIYYITTTQPIDTYPRRWLPNDLDIES